MIGEPLPVEDAETKNDFDGGEEFDFTFDIALAPKFDLTVSADDHIPYYNIPVNDKEKEEYKKQLAEHPIKTEVDQWKNLEKVR